MKVIECEQNTPDWYQARIGLPTASAFSKLLTSTGKPSKQANTYAKKLAAELYAGKPLDVYTNGNMERGHEQEDEARDLYALTYGVTVEQIGFVTTDDGTAGCSPDGLTGDKGMVEIKSRKAEIQVETLLAGKPPTENIAQMQGQMWICGRQWCDYVSYHPDLPLFVFRVDFDPGFAASLLIAIRQVITERDKYLSAIKKYAQE